MNKYILQRYWEFEISSPPSAAIRLTESITLGHAVERPILQPQNLSRIQGSRIKTWTLSFPGGEIKNGPKAERKAKIITPKVLFRGPGTSVNTDSEMLGKGQESSQSRCYTHCSIQLKQTGTHWTIKPVLSPGNGLSPSEGSDMQAKKRKT